MRIAVLSNLYPPLVLGGYEVGAAQVVAELRRRGHEVLVLSAHDCLLFRGRSWRRLRRPHARRNEVVPVGPCLFGSTLWDWYNAEPLPVLAAGLRTLAERERYLAAL